jgi:hypothetical protein
MHDRGGRAASTSGRARLAARSGARRVARKKAAFENEHPPRGTPRRRNTERKTYLLPWGCHTIMELVLATLPVETTRVLLRTGATAERAAMVIDFRVRK